jgi:hypothetical protein
MRLSLWIVRSARIGAKQQENAGKQQEIASQQHLNADKLEAKAAALDVLGDELQYKAIEMSAETELTPVRAGKPIARPLFEGC